MYCITRRAIVERHGRLAHAFTTKRRRERLNDMPLLRGKHSQVTSQFSNVAFDAMPL